MARLSTKNFIASSTVSLRMSSTFLCLYDTFMTCSLKRLPPHLSQSTSTSARNCMSIVTVPAPSHVSQRPPVVLMARRPGPLLPPLPEGDPQRRPQGAAVGLAVAGAAHGP